MPEQIESRQRVQVIFPALTIEVTLYAAFAFAGFAVRLFLVGDAPLAFDEARQALASWNFVRGTPDAYTGSPLLFTGNALLFTLFGASDGMARFLPALFGSALVLLPGLLRRELGRVGALIASVLLMSSPSLVFFSREADGAILAVTCALTALAFAWRYATDRAARDLYCAAIFAALALLAAREVWTVVLAVALFALARWGRFGIAARSEPRSDSGVALRGTPLRFVPDYELRRAAILFALVFIGIATTFLLHRDGIGAAFDLFGAWLEGLRPGGSPFDPLRLLIVYEPSVLFFGVVALIDLAFAAQAADRDQTPLVALAFWIVAAFVLYSIGADKNPARVVALVVPLALVAGWYIGAWLTRAAQEFEGAPNAVQTLLTQEASVFALASALAIFLYFVLAEFSTRGSVLAAELLTTILGRAQGAAATGFNGVAISVLIVAAFAAVAFLAVTTVGWVRARNVGIALALTLLTVWTIRQAALVNFPAGGTHAQRVQEWLIARATSPNVRDLVSDLEDVSRWRANDSHTLAIVADDSLGPIVAWNLREFRNARFAARPRVAQDAQAVLLPPNALTPAADWIEQRYRLEIARGASPQITLWRWLIFREVGGVESSDIVLWIPKPQ